MWTTWPIWSAGSPKRRHFRPGRSLRRRSTRRFRYGGFSKFVQSDSALRALSFRFPGNSFGSAFDALKPSRAARGRGATAFWALSIPMPRRISMRRSFRRLASQAFGVSRKTTRRARPSLDGGALIGGHAAKAHPAGIREIAGQPNAISSRQSVSSNRLITSSERVLRGRQFPSAALMVLDHRGGEPIKGRGSTGRDDRIVRADKRDAGRFEHCEIGQVRCVAEDYESIIGKLWKGRDDGGR